MRRLIIPILAAAFFAGCTVSDKAPVIREGRDVCAECNMIILEKQFACAYEVDGEFLKFDDVGCLLEHVKKTPDEKTWLRDFSSGEWIKGGQAKLVRLKDVKSPMGYGLAAFKKEER